MKHAQLIAGFLILVVLPSNVQAQDWQPAKGRLMTRWAADVSPDQVHPEYPRPQMVRPDWWNLNGLWDYAVTDSSEVPDRFDGKILVPFPVESALSGVMKRVSKDSTLWYRREFNIPADWRGRCVLLHFCAVDFETNVIVNGKSVGTHRGGYDTFSFDITDQLLADKRQEILVAVRDPTDAGVQARGKQRNEPRGIWYTPTTGIWQTVWLEPVPETRITNLRITPDIDQETVSVKVSCQGLKSEQRLSATQTLNGATVAENFLDIDASVSRSGEVALTLHIPKARLWSPDDPLLYDLKVQIRDAEGGVADEVSSYVGMRKISVEQDSSGVPRLFLNNRLLFQYGPLDQGFWPDGLYTAPTDEALRYDLEMTRRLGFNMVRKHVKVEPDRWYYWCDKLGLLVWQDMPNGDGKPPWPRDGVEFERTDESKSLYRQELQAMVDQHYNHPCIVTWVPFNEAWGQSDTVAVTEWLQQYDPSRLVISASGGNDFGVGHINDDHFYPGPGAPPVESKRVAVLGEFGGLGLPLAGHTWQEKKNWGYRSFKTKTELTDAYLNLMKRLRPLVETQLGAAVYTQTTDVEIEVNGLMTYDRSVLKIDAETIAHANRRLYEPLPELSDVQKSGLSTIAWWRFEDGTAGDPIPNVKDSPKKIGVRDVSGHNNHLYAFGRPQAPRFGSEVPAETVSLTGQANRGCLDDSGTPADRIPTRDLFTDPGRSRTHMDVINTFPFNEWTVEVSFNISETGRFHGLVGRDGQPTEAAQAPLQLKVRGDDNCVQIEAIDSSGTVRDVRGRTPVETGRWYHAAAVSDGATLKLYLDAGDGQGYRLQRESDFSGPLFRSPGTWTVGRGHYNGKIADDARALIDEVRVSVVALKPNRFLFADH